MLDLFPDNTPRNLLALACQFISASAIYDNTNAEYTDRLKIVESVVARALEVLPMIHDDLQTKIKYAKPTTSTKPNEVAPQAEAGAVGETVEG